MFFASVPTLASLMLFSASMLDLGEEISARASAAASYAFSLVPPVPSKSRKLSTRFPALEIGDMSLVFAVPSFLQIATEVGVSS